MGKYLCCLLLWLLSATYMFGQNVYHTGLKFFSAPVPKENRTSLNLTPQVPLKVRQRFALQFDISLYDTNNFGYVFRAYNNSTNFDLIFSPPEKDYANLKLIIDGKLSNVVVPIKAEEMRRNRWFTARLIFDFEIGVVSCVVNDKHVNTSIKQSDLIQQFNVVFGANYSSQFRTTDVPCMSIRNIRVYDNELRMSSNWLLDEIQGDIARDLAGGEAAHVIHPYWLINDHFFWKQVAEISSNGGVTVLESNKAEELLILDRRQLFRYNTYDQNFSTREFDHPLKDLSNNTPSFLNSNENSILRFDFKNKLTYNYDIDKNHWINYKQNDEQLPLSTATFLALPKREKIIAFGGYDKYKFSNSFFEYGFKTKKWKKSEVSGSKIIPRHYSAMTATDDDSLVYIFGGFGNQSGHQELGSRCLSDLYQIDFKHRWVQKLWESPKASSFIPTDKAIYNNHDENIYTLGFEPFSNSTLLRLYKTSKNNSTSWSVSDTIHFSFKESNRSARLFFNDSTQEFIATVETPITTDSTILKIYTLAYPPINQKHIDNSYLSAFDWEGKLPNNIYIVSGVMIIIAIFGFIFMAKRLISIKDEQDSEQNGTFINGWRNDVRKIEEKRVNHIQIFRRAKVFDRDGVDISTQFTPKLQQLFLFILTSNLNNNNGVPSKLIDETLWPYHTQSSAKNNRSVNSKKLRNLLSNIDGISLICENSLWHIEIDQEASCDLHFVYKILNDDSGNIGQDDVEQGLAYLASGTTVGINEEWMEKFMSQFTDNLQNALLEMIDRLTIKLYPKLCNRIAKTMLKIDSVNEDALHARVKSLIALKKHKDANSEFNSFIREYEKLYGEPYEHTFKHFVKKPK